MDAMAKRAMEAMAEYGESARRADLARIRLVGILLQALAEDHEGFYAFAAEAGIRTGDLAEMIGDFSGEECAVYLERALCAPKQVWNYQASRLNCAFVWIRLLSSSARTCSTNNQPPLFPSVRSGSA